MAWKAHAFVIEEHEVPSLRTALLFRADRGGLRPMDDDVASLLLRHHGNGLLLDREEQELALTALRDFPAPTEDMLELQRQLESATEE